jgi:hypothetical protein
MSSSIGRNTAKAGDHLDESAVPPSPKAYQPPLEEARISFEVHRDHVSMAAEAKMCQGLRGTVNHIAVCAVATTIAMVIVALCWLYHAPGLLALVVAAIGFGVPLAIGFIRTSSDDTPRR